MLEKSIKAVIFDMDGVISDTQDVHAKTESTLLKEYGVELTPDEITRKYSGVTDEDMFKDIFLSSQKDMPNLEQLVVKKREIVNQLLQNNVVEVSGTRDFIELLKLHNLPLAVASGSMLSLIEIILSELNLRSKFEAIASAEEVTRGKPEPDVFLLAASRLSTSPENCLVIEDGISGMIAARRAGMQCVGLVKDLDYSTYPADFLVRDLRSVPIEQYLFQ